MSASEAGAAAVTSQQSEHGDFLGAYPDGIEHHYWSVARNRMIQRIVSQYGRPDAPVLEIGCARGVVTGSLRGCGIDCWGVDLEKSSPMNAEVGAYLQTGVDFFDLDVDWVSRFETVLMLDVLEHIEKPAEFLGLVSSRLTNSQRIIVTMPARMELWSNYDEHYGHYLRYDRGTMNEMAHEAGMRVVSCGYGFRSLCVAGWMTARLGIKRSVDIKAPGGLMRPVHGAIAGMMSLGFELIPEAIAGSSIYAVLQPVDPGRRTKE